MQDKCSSPSCANKRSVRKDGGRRGQRQVYPAKNDIKPGAALQF